MHASVKISDRLSMPIGTGTVVGFTKSGSTIIALDESGLDEMVFNIDAQVADGKVTVIA